MVNPATCAYLESLGLEPADIMVNDISERGYYKFARRDDMRYYVQESESYARSWHEWPDTFDFEKLVACWLDDGHDVYRDVFFY